MEVLGSTCNALWPDEIVRGHKANLLLNGTDCDLKPEPTYQEPASEYAAPPQATPAPDPIQQLKDLAELRDQGVLTEEEFAAQKARILNT